MNNKEIPTFHEHLKKLEDSLKHESEIFRSIIGLKNYMDIFELRSKSNNDLNKIFIQIEENIRDVINEQPSYNSVLYIFKIWKHGNMKLWGNIHNKRFSRIRT